VVGKNKHKYNLSGSGMSEGSSNLMDGVQTHLEKEKLHRCQRSKDTNSRNPQMQEK
jgi:hypothetical protein